MRINDEGQLVYDVTEVPLELLYEDLSYTILSSREPKKILPIVKEAVGGELRFLFNHDLINHLESTLSDEIKDYLHYKLFNVLLEAVALKFIKHIKERAKDDPIDLSEFYEKVISQDDETKVWCYTPTEDNDTGEYNENKKLAEMFLYEVVEPSTKYLLDKYCDKHYEVIVSETTERVYETINFPLDGMTNDETIASLKDEEYKEVKNITVKRNFKGYTKRNVEN